MNEPGHKPTFKGSGNTMEPEQMPVSKRELNKKTSRTEGFESEERIKEWMILNQFGRRNLSSYQRGLLALELKSLFQQKAKKNLINAGESFGKGLQKSAKAIEPIDTRKEVAKLANVSHDTISKVEKIRDKAPEELLKGIP